jgi:hypothetical protein
MRDISQEVSMKRIATGLAAAAVLAAGVAVAPSAMAGGSVAVSIGLPGLAVGYSNNGYGYVAAAPVPYAAPYVAPAPYYAAPYAAPVVTYPAPVVYAPYYRPYYRAYSPYYYRGPVRVGYYGHWH